MATRTVIKNDPGFIHEFKYWDDDKRPSWKRYGKGHGVLRIHSHEKNKYLDIQTSEHSVGEGDKVTSKETYICLAAEDAAKFYGWMKNLFEGSTAKPGDVPMPMTKVAIQTLNKRGKAIMEIMQAVRANRTKKKMKPSELAMTLASYQMELDALNLAISALEEKLPVDVKAKTG